MKAAEVERILEAIRMIADGEVERAEAQAKGAVGEAFAAGMLNLRDELLQALDVREFAEAEDAGTNTDGLIDAMTVFCFRWCAYSREDEPGEHRVCARCPLAKHTVQRLRAGADAALQGGDDV